LLVQTLSVLKHNEVANASAVLYHFVSIPIWI